MSVNASHLSGPFELFRHVGQTRQTRSSRGAAGATHYSPPVGAARPEKRHLIRKLFLGLLGYKLLKAAARHLPFSSLLQHGKNNLNLFA
ncbi:MAG: hypothetical protein AB7P76_12715 [Candidatus Melainabacteria bacterium]